MSKKKIVGSIFIGALLVFGLLQLLPAAPLVLPAELPTAQREAHRLLNFQDIPNFRDLGGYTTNNGKQVKWGALYRTGTLTNASNADLKGLKALGLKTLIDLRSTAEKKEEPDRLPDPLTFTVVEIPVLDDANEAMVGDGRRYYGAHRNRKFRGLRST